MKRIGLTATIAAAAAAATWAITLDPGRSIAAGAAALAGIALALAGLMAGAAVYWRRRAVAQAKGCDAHGAAMIADLDHVTALALAILDAVPSHRFRVTLAQLADAGAWELTDTQTADVVTITRRRRRHHKEA